MSAFSIICALIALVMWPFGIGYFMGYRQGSKRRVPRMGGIGGLDGSIPQDVG